MFFYGNNCHYCKDNKIGRYDQVDTNWFKKNNDSWPWISLRDIRGWLRIQINH